MSESEVNDDSPVNSEVNEHREEQPDETRLSTAGNAIGNEPDVSFSRFSRVSVGLLGLFPLILLAITTQLSPSQEGLGTHQQLGLPPCSMRVVFGVRCPACGMTTSWSYFVRGQWGASIATNPGGFLLAFYSLVFAGLCFLCVRRNRMPAYRAQEWMVKTLLGIVLITIVNWCWVLMR